jgi:hypothetical protein
MYSLFDCSNGKSVEALSFLDESPQESRTEVEALDGSLSITAVLLQWRTKP